MVYTRRLKVEVITPTGPAAAAEALEVTLPASDGMVGILGGHAPMVLLLGAGLLTTRPAEGPAGEYFIAGGFAHVLEDSVAILAEQCVEISQLDAEQAWSQIDRAKAMPQDTPEAIKLRDDALHVARTRFRLAQLARRRKREAVKARLAAAGEE